MPGLVGFTTPLVTTNKPEAIIRAMRDSLVHRPFHCRDTIFEDSCICASRVHLDTVRDGPEHCTGAGISVWLDGEFYNKDIFGETAQSDARVVLEQYQRGAIVSFAQKINGIFTTVIYDQSKKSVTIVGDRYGLRHIYIFRSPAGCAWASELKAFRCLPSRSFTVDREAATQFFSKGYLAGKRTWFGDVELLPPGTILTINCDSRETTAQRYWTGKPDSARDEKPDLQELARELGIRFKRAVERQCPRGERVGLGLSGGLDSRAIFAAMPPYCEPIQAFTFGIPGSKDMRIAQKVTALRPSKQYAYELSANNWLKNRADAVWWTDGQFNLLHMHGIEHAGSIRETIDVSLNGLQSDLLLGACHENSEGEEIPYFPDRDRRFFAMGVILATQEIIYRTPFFDNDFMEFTRSIPLRFRRNSHIFHKMLLATFPEYYRDIPWQRTNLPISRDSLIDRAGILAMKCAGRVASKFNVRLRNDDYTDYPSWIRQPPAREFFSGLLTDTHSRIFDFVDQRRVRRCLDRHMRGFNYSELIGRYATFEVWLRRFYGNE
jgi:asparagine synthase (glutamine-hydrolysing)